MKSKIADIILLQVSLIIFSSSAVFAKMASALPFRSASFVKYIILALAAMGLYALLWQQILKKLSLTVAYSNRSIIYFWLLLWSVIFFNGTVTANNLIGLAFVIFGIVIASRGA